ncbi:MAG TPA: PilC/PilY family type IV pilus protein [Gammaproteobacteria bacterium]|nr:PilC/PilY family type IV pilus protein [Gammaproteobacteria bacterium]
MNLHIASKKILTALAVAGFTLANLNAAHAGTVSQMPLFLSTAAEPNVILGIDNSGSMDFEVLFPTNDGALWWNDQWQSFVGCDQNDNCISPTSSDTFNFNKAGNFGNTGPWLKYAYLFPFNGVNVRNTPNNTAAAQGHYFLPPLPQYAWARSPDYNNAYFNPGVTYTPWMNANGTPVYTAFDAQGDINPAAAPDDPVLYPSTTVDLTSEIGCLLTALPSCASTPPAWTTPWFMLQQGMTLPVGTVVWNPNGNSGTGQWQAITVPAAIPNSSLVNPNNSTWFTKTNNDGTTSDQYLAIAYFPATFWLKATDSLPSNYGYIGVPLTGSGPAGEPMLGYEIKPTNFTSAAQYTAAMQNFANWFSYYRKRHLALRASLSQTFVGLSNMRVSCSYMNSDSSNGCPSQGSGTNLTMYDLNNPLQKAALFTNFFNNSGSGGTPTWQLLNYIGQQFQRTDSGAPITQACQKNFGIIFTDGYANYPYPSWPYSGSGDTDSSTGAPYGALGFGTAPYADGVPGTLGDLATYFYANNLRPGMPAGQVTPDSACGTPNAPPGLDCNKNLHMDTYAVTLVQQGLIWNVNMPATQNPFQNPPPWPTVFQNRSPTGIDDLWHATLDGHGQMFAAQTPQLIAQQLQQVLNSIASRTSSAAAIATNSTRLDTNTFIYQARFKTTDWSGQLLAFKVNPDGSIAANATWDAGQQIPGAASRNIATWNPSGGTSGTGAGTAFEWNTLSSAQQTALNLNPGTGTADGLGADRVTWLRGGAVPSTDGFRTRSTPLGDIVNSNPLYVQDTNFDYNDAPSYSSSACGGSSTSGTTTTGVNGKDVGAQCYAQYFVSQLNRTPVVYVGANDGMLHAFNANTGQEMFAFVPNTVIPALNKLMASNYSANHQFYVDGTPTLGDAFNLSSGAWGTYLVGTTGAGGSGVFALNITNPGSNTEANAASWVMWGINSGTTCPYSYYVNGTLVTGTSTSLCFADMGYTIPRASIALMNNGQYVAIVSNGFDSSTGAAAVFIINLFSGQLIAEIKIPGVTGDGLAAAVPVDTNQPADRVTNFLYAGDVQGNLWKFDVTSTSPANWCVSNNSGGCIKSSATTATPLFKAVDASGVAQPITVRPVVGLSNNSTPQIYFGTGKYFETGDNVVPATPQVQTFYSIIDGGTGAVTRSQLLQQQILATQQVTVNGTTSTIRVSTNNPTNSSPPGGPSAMTQPGWYMDLLNQPGATGTGEMVVSSAVLDNDRIVFTTLIPNTNPCGFGGTSFLMELNALTGSRLMTSPFDMNGDGHFTSGDFVTVTVTVGGVSQTLTVPVSGQQSTVGIIQTPAIISASSVEYKFASGSTGQILSVVESPAAGGGRQSWVQLQ